MSKSANKEYTFDKIYICGDVHAQYECILDLCESMPHNSLIIQVGDFGRGFILRPRQSNYFSEIVETLREKNSNMWVIRGNHDDPREFFNNESIGDIEFLNDYTYRIINGETFMFVGGATSIDRHLRMERRGKYWEDEKVLYCPEKITGECDVLITHSPPECCFPVDSDRDLEKVITYYCPNVQEWREKLFNDLRVERKILNRVLLKTKPKKAHYYGHMHKSHEEIKNGCKHKLLDIDEIIEYK